MEIIFRSQEFVILFGVVNSTHHGLECECEATANLLPSWKSLSVRVLETVWVCFSEKWILFPQFSVIHPARYSLQRMHEIFVMGRRRKNVSLKNEDGTRLGCTEKAALVFAIIIIHPSMTASCVRVIEFS